MGRDALLALMCRRKHPVAFLSLIEDGTHRRKGVGGVEQQQQQQQQQAAEELYLRWMDGSHWRH
jgi:hypothetical protein